MSLESWITAPGSQRNSATAPDGVQSRYVFSFQSPLQCVYRPSDMLLSPVTPLLVVLHWLRIPQHIQYKLCYWSTSTYTGPQCTELPAERHLPGRECGITASPALRVIGRSHRAGEAIDVQQWATAPSPSQHRAPGTVCRTRSVAAHL